MTIGWSFDAPHYQQITRARLRFLDTFLPQLVQGAGWRTALDVGCGVGEFTQYLAGLGLEASGADGRESNVAEARERYPHLPFATCDVEAPASRGLGQFDVVLCYGLLYHLDNPVAALRNLHALTGGGLLIETQIFPRPGLAYGLVIENDRQDDQGIRNVALVPSEQGLIKTLYQVGFAHVYAFRALPDHDDFRATRRYHRRRTCLVASRAPLQLPQLVLAREPAVANHWIRPLAGAADRWRGRAARALRYGLARLSRAAPR